MLKPVPLNSFRSGKVGCASMTCALRSWPDSPPGRLDRFPGKGPVSAEAHKSAAPDEPELSAPTAPRLLLRPGESDRLANLRWYDWASSKGGTSSSIMVASQKCCK
jgi:hypothetical protein